MKSIFTKRLENSLNDNITLKWDLTWLIGSDGSIIIEWVENCVKMRKGWEKLFLKFSKYWITYESFLEFKEWFAICSHNRWPGWRPLYWFIDQQWNILCKDFELLEPFSIQLKWFAQCKYPNWISTWWIDKNWLEYGETIIDWKEYLIKDWKKFNKNCLKIKNK